MAISKRLLQLSVLLIGLFISSFVSNGQSADKVYAVLFFSPTCPHCHQLILEDLPPIQEQFGDDLVMLIIDITTESGNAVALSAYEYYNIPRDNWVVPMMVVNEQVLIGGLQIPSQLPLITEVGLQTGGIPIPSFPLMQATFDEWQAENPELSSVKSSMSPITKNFEQDALATTITILILLGVIISFIGLMMTRQSGLPVFIPQIAITITTLVTVFIAITITLAEQHDTLALPIARVTLVGMVIAALTAIVGRRIQVTVSLVAFLGMVVSAYMAYVEITTNPAVCGVIGDCNAVQQSEYAYLMGIPIGVMGIIGYLMILILSIAMRRFPITHYPQLLTILKGLVGASALFTIYLTFLELFVIGAVCAWCLLSALVVLNLMWLVMPMVQDKNKKHRATHYLLYQAT